MAQSLIRLIGLGGYYMLDVEPAVCMLLYGTDLTALNQHASLLPGFLLSVLELTGLLDLTLGGGCFRFTFCVTRDAQADRQAVVRHKPSVV
jgi:hypothetical protein